MLLVHYPSGPTCLIISMVDGGYHDMDALSCVIELPKSRSHANAQNNLPWCAKYWIIRLLFKDNPATFRICRAWWFVAPPMDSNYLSSHQIQTPKELTQGSPAPLTSKLPIGSYSQILWRACHSPEIKPCLFLNVPAFLNARLPLLGISRI